MSKHIKITESQYRFLTEDVFVNDVNKKKGTASLTYKHRDGSYTRNKGVVIKGDNLKTDKMDNNDGKTYEVKLKNGFVSYNITSINGTEVMHYFKRLFDNQKTTIKDQNKNEYELIMADNECNQFMQQFNNKVGNVVEWAIRGFKQQNPNLNFDTCFIYPVPSSSNFNIEMANLMRRQNICGLSVETLNPSILRKNTRNLEIDQDFVDKNQEYYNSNRTKQDKFPGTHRQALDTAHNKLKAWNNAYEYIDLANEYVEQLLKLYYRGTKAKNPIRYYTKMAELYKKYVDSYNQISDSTAYIDATNGQTKKLMRKTVSSGAVDDNDVVASMKKRTKPIQVSDRSNDIYQALKQYVPQLMQGVPKVDIQRWEKKNFQIKKEFNDVRMGLKNWFQPDENQELVQQEVNRVNEKASVVVVFDDNVSGGATLADICMQLKQLGMNYIIPITFGVMRESWANAAIQVIEPENWNYESVNRSLRPINELKEIAQKSRITVASLQDFKSICSRLGVNDSNVGDYVGQYCFIEIGSSEGRINAELPHSNPLYDQDGQEYNTQRFFNEGQWYFQSEHPNVIKLIFDDNQKFNNKMPGEKAGFDGKTPATAVKLSSHENKYNKSFTFYYTNGEDFTDDKAQRLKQFVDNNISQNPGVKFIIHCMQGMSRSAAVGMYIANKVGEFTHDMLSEYDIDDNTSQIKIGADRKGNPKYPHKNVMTKMGELEGWNKAKDDTKKQWFYDTLTTKPNTGYNDQKKRKETT